MGHASTARPRRSAPMTAGQAKEIDRRASLILWKIRDGERRAYRAPTVAPTSTLPASPRPLRADRTSAAYRSVQVAYEEGRRRAARLYPSG